MATNYPGGYDTFRAHLDGVQEVILGQTVNRLQDGMAAVQAQLGLSPKGGYLSVGAGLADLAARSGEVVDVKRDFNASGGGFGDDTAAFNSAAQAALLQNKPLNIPRDKYRITSALDFRGDRLLVIGNGAQIQQASNNTPILRLGGQLQNIGNLRLTYLTPQIATQTSGNAIEFSTALFGYYHDLELEGTGRGLYLAQSLWGSYTLNAILGSTFQNIHVHGYSLSAVTLLPYPAGNLVAGNVFTNIRALNDYAGYAVSGAFGGTIGAAAEGGFIIQDADAMFINGLYIAFSNFTSSFPFAISRVRGGFVTGLDFDTVTVNGTNGFCLILDDSNASFRGVTIKNSTVAADAGNKSIFRVGNNSTTNAPRVSVSGVRLRNNTTTGVAQFGMVDIITGTTNADVRIQQADTDSLVGQYVTGDTYPNTQVDAVGAIDYTRRYLSQPQDSGYRAWSLDPRATNAAGALTTGVLFTTRLVVPEAWASGTTITGEWYTAVASSGGGADNNIYVGLYRFDTGARIAVSGNLSAAAAWGNAGAHSVALTLAAAKPEGVDVYAAFVAGAQRGTAAQLARGSATIGLRAPNVAWTGGTGLTALPATLPTLTASTQLIFVAVY